MKIISPIQLSPSTEGGQLEYRFCSLDAYGRREGKDIVLFKEDDESGKDKELPIDDVRLKRSANKLSLMIDDSKEEVRERCGLHASFDQPIFDLRHRATPIAGSKQECSYRGVQVYCGP